MSKPPRGVPPAAARSVARLSRLGPLGLALVALVALAVLWLLLQLWLHLLGIATSPLGWLLSLIGTLVGLVTAKTG